MRMASHCPPDKAKMIKPKQIVACGMPIWVAYTLPRHGIPDCHKFNVHKKNSFYIYYLKGGGDMAVKKLISKPEPQALANKYFKTIEQMSLISGIGENTLRLLIENGEIDYISIGNHRLIADTAIWDWYERNKVAAVVAKESEDRLCQSITAR